MFINLQFLNFITYWHRLISPELPSYIVLVIPDTFVLISQCYPITSDIIFQRKLQLSTSKFKKFKKLKFVKKSTVVSHTDFVNSVLCFGWSCLNSSVSSSTVLVVSRTVLFRLIFQIIASKCSKSSANSSFSKEQSNSTLDSWRLTDDSVDALTDFSIFSFKLYQKLIISKVKLLIIWNV